MFTNSASLRKVFTIVAVVWLAACFDEEIGNPTMAGDYSLRRVNGSALPFAETTNDVKTEILDDVMSLYQGNTYSELIHLRVTANGVVTMQTITETGNFGGQGTSLLFTRNSKLPSRQSTVNNRTITITEPGTIKEYVKDN